MRVNAIEYRSGELDERKPEAIEEQPGLLTPARRAALDALEREFAEYLKKSKPH